MEPEGSVTPSVQRFFDQVANAYRASPVEVLIVVLLVVGLIAGLVAYAVVRSRKEEREQRELARRLFDEKTSQVALSPSQRELLALMRRYLRDPVNVHHLVTDEVAFNAAAARLREEGGADAAAIAALRVTLGFHTGRGERAPSSSAAIPPGSTVLVARNKYRKPARTRVLEPSPQSFRVQILEEGARLPPGAAVDVYFHSSAGVFTFHTTILSESGGVVEMSHSEELERYQKRRYYRRKIALPVRILPFDSDRALLSRFREIGGGGASLVNPEGHFKAGDELELRFRSDDDEIRLTGTVVRVSDSGRVIHVNYEHIKEGLRDRIYRAIFKPPKDEQEAMRRAAAQGVKTTE